MRCGSSFRSSLSYSLTRTRSSTCTGYGPIAGFTGSISPNLGDLEDARGRLVHPKGWIEVDLTVRDGELAGTIVLPEGVSGVFDHEGSTEPLASGKTTVKHG